MDSIVGREDRDGTRVYIYYVTLMIDDLFN